MMTVISLHKNGMKTYLSLIITMLVLLVAGCTGNTGKKDKAPDIQASDTGKAVITFVSLVHDFGKVNEGEKVGCIFSFRNTGTVPLIVTSAVTSCGCTVPKYERSPVAPGSDGSIEVVFDTSGRDGTQTKTITVQSNAVTPVMMLQIKAEVINNN